MSLAERIRNLMEDQSLTQAKLAAKLNVHPSSIANYLYDQRKPDALACLLLAGLARDTESRMYFIQESRLSDEQLFLISAATKPGPGDPTIKLKRKVG